ncbi:hypothetical protein GIB67_016673 [Kingdonia uniflora]|uniref:Uncharacterized protein n=1 Tax=Kingdonia uniflora TaxID=39325 RepID=A0A7J7MEL3_9MAGN|nr:hypothetical protein GIB67_016673 [Kingdonia uniflora]
MGGNVNSTNTLVESIEVFKAAGYSLPPDGARGRKCIMKDMYGRTIAYKSIQLSGVAPEGFYRVIVDGVILDDVQLFMEGGTQGDISSGETVV